MSSRLPSLSGHFPITTSLVLRPAACRKFRAVKKMESPEKTTVLQGMLIPKAKVPAAAVALGASMVDRRPGERNRCPPCWYESQVPSSFCSSGGLSEIQGRQENGIARKDDGLTRHVDTQGQSATTDELKTPKSQWTFPHNNKFGSTAVHLATWLKAHVVLLFRRLVGNSGPSRKWNRPKRRRSYKAC
jgi:hypothetical protein